MTSPHDSLFPAFLALALLTGPALAATSPKRPVAAKPAPVVIEPQPDAADLITKAHAAQDRGEADLALRLAQAAIVAAPARPATYVALGDVYAAQGQPEAARSYYNEALSIDPADDAALKAMAALDHDNSQRSANAQGPKTGTP